MLNKEVFDKMNWLWSVFDIRLLTFIAAGFTIYFGYQKVSKKLCVSFSIEASRLYDSHISNFAITNKRDNTVILSSIKMRIGNKGSVQLIKFDKLLLLKGYETISVDIPKYSELWSADGPVSIDFDDRLIFSAITGSGKIIACDIESPLTFDGIDGRITKRTHEFNGIILTSSMEYIFNYFVNGESSNVIFDKGGMISGKSPFSFNFLPGITSEMIENYLLNNGFHDYFEDYALFVIDERLSTELVFTKKQINDKYIQSEN